MRTGCLVNARQMEYTPQNFVIAKEDIICHLKNNGNEAYVHFSVPENVAEGQSIVILMVKYALGAVLLERANRFEGTCLAKRS